MTKRHEIVEKEVLTAITTKSDHISYEVGFAQEKIRRI